MIDRDQQRFASIATLKRSPVASGGLNEPQLEGHVRLGHPPEERLEVCGGYQQGRCKYDRRRVRTAYGRRGWLPALHMEHMRRLVEGLRSNNKAIGATLGTPRNRQSHLNGSDGERRKSDISCELH